MGIEMGVDVEGEGAVVLKLMNNANRGPLAPPTPSPQLGRSRGILGTPPVLHPHLLGKNRLYP